LPAYPRRRPCQRSPCLRATSRVGRWRIRRACLCFRTPAWRSSHRAYSAGLPRRLPTCVIGTPTPLREQREDTFPRDAGPVYPSPLPPAREQDGKRVCLSRSSSQGSATRPFSRATALRRRRLLSVLAPWVHATHRRFHRRATPTLGLAGPPVQRQPRDYRQIQPSYWFRGATATPWYSRPMMSARAFTRVGSLALGLVSGRLVVTVGFTAARGP
jgi:hypothetical protein